jgi:Rod binding domain-containing protein
MSPQSIQAAYGTSLTPAQVAKVRSQAEEFEGVFLNTLVKEMFATLKGDGGFGGETWRSMQSEQLAASMAGNGGLGIADQMLGDLLAMQEAANHQINQPTYMGVTTR